METRSRNEDYKLSIEPGQLHSQGEFGVRAMQGVRCGLALIGVPRVPVGSFYRRFWQQK
jgi:hypothetical protein